MIMQWQPLVLPSYRGDNRGVFVVGPPAGPTTNRSSPRVVTGKRAIEKLAGWRVLIRLARLKELVSDPFCETLYMKPKTMGIFLTIFHLTAIYYCHNPKD
jgi:hypothetical protein